MYVTIVFAMILLLSHGALSSVENQEVSGTPTGQACQTNDDCSDQGHWCRSGQYCLKQRCHRLVNYPCQPGQFCLEREKRCVDSQTCTGDKDCDNGIYCDGPEQCVYNKCRNNYRFFCAGCVESNRTCPRAKTISNNRVDVQTTAPTATPTTTNTTTGLNEQQLWMIGFLMAGGVAITLFFFYIITAAARPATPNSVVFITQTLDGDGGDGDDSQNSNSRQLLTTQAYQQRIYYR